MHIPGLDVDYVLFFRLGDFYEFFFEDAIRVSQILGIALTTRGKYKGSCHSLYFDNPDKDIPLCGIPYFTVDNYVKKIIRRGLKVAICEQTEVGVNVLIPSFLLDTFSKQVKEAEKSSARAFGCPIDLCWNTG